jgi:EAL domain-containing protein (putative c-di-GMP-specific phosphodiesterase class I)
MPFVTDYSDIDINRILEKELVEVHFQPLFSIREKKIIGFEGLSRGVHPKSGKLIPPLPLLKLAKDADLTLELDRLFRKKIMEAFKKCCPQPHDLILSLNFETSVIDKEIGTLHLINLCRQLDLNPSNILIEILESKVRNVEGLEKFVHIHREHGFLIALDDVGKGHSNFDRIPIIQPDVIKIDRSLVTNIHEDYYRQEIFKSLVHLAQKIGALSLAEGVETEEESLTCLELGADLLQGYYFAKPQEPSGDFISQTTGKINPIADKFRKHMVDKFNIKKMQHERYGLMVETMAEDFSKVTADEMDAKVSQELLSNPVAQAIYVLDQDGLQATILSTKTPENSRQGIFRLPHKGTDYSLRDYYYALMDPGFKRKTFTSEPYISPATGLFCVTLSSSFKTSDQKLMVLCVDVVPTYLKNMSKIMTLLKE